MDWIAAGEAASGPITWGLNQAFSKKNTERQKKANKELAKYQWDLNMQQWNASNAYNTPAAQRQRLIDANLNPALMYKGAPQNVAVNSPTYQEQATNTDRPLMNDLGFLDKLGQSQQLRHTKAVTDNVAEDTNLKKSKIQTEALNQARTAIGTAKSSQEMRQAKLLFDSVLEQSQQSAKKMRIEKRLRKEELELREQGASYQDNPMIRFLIKNFDQLNKLFKQSKAGEFFAPNF